MAQRPKGDTRKVRIAQRLRDETAITVKWIAKQLHMGTWTHVANRLHQTKVKSNPPTNMNSTLCKYSGLTPLQKFESKGNMSSFKIKLKFLVWSLSMFWLCGCGHPKLDQARELVNAAGVSTNEVIRVLSKGADINQRSISTFGRTPLISAIYNHKKDVIDILLARGADANLGDGEHQTPLNWAIEVWDENTNVIQTLIDHGADPRIRNRYGTDAFNLAQKQISSVIILDILSRATNITASSVTNR